MSARGLALEAALLGALTAATSAQAQTECATPEACTRALAATDAQARLVGDLACVGVGPCVVVGGAGARFDGGGHTLRVRFAGATGVRVEGHGAGVRSLRVKGGAVGLLVAGARDVTVYNVRTEARGVGLSVEAAPGLRIERLHASGGRVGVSFGASASGVCPTGAAMRSPGAVVVGSRLEGAEVGLAACDARPVLTGNALIGNGVGAILGDPSDAAGAGGAAPHDPCLCAPSLAGIRPGTLALFSSGCGGCMVHEAWLPSLRARGADLLARESGRGTEEAEGLFDRWAWRCLPGVMDSLGIPGCVPNYGCAASGELAKRRQDDQSLAVDVSIGSEDDVLSMARRCAGSAQARYAADGCELALAWVDNSFCDSRTIDLRVLGGSSRYRGARNRCARVEGFGSGCDLRCTDTVPAPPLGELRPPAAPPVRATVDAPPLAPSTSRALSAADVPPPWEDSSFYWLSGCAAAIGVGAWLLRRK